MSDHATFDTCLAAFLLSRGYVLLRIDGPAHQRWFHFDKPIEPSLVTMFLTSPEKKVLDNHRALKTALAQATG